MDLDTSVKRTDDHHDGRVHQRPPRRHADHRRETHTSYRTASRDRRDQSSTERRATPSLICRSHAPELTRIAIAMRHAHCVRFLVKKVDFRDRRRPRKTPPRRPHVPQPHERLRSGAKARLEPAHQRLHRPVYYRSAKQLTTCLSSFQSELIALSDSAKQVLWLRNFLIA